MTDRTPLCSGEILVAPREGPGTAATRTPIAATFCIVAFQQERFIAECLESALIQDYPNLRIVVSDDASTDRTSEIVQDILSSYKGPHETLFIQQPRNLRIHHLNALTPQLLAAPFTVLGHGDDVFHPDRASKSIRAMQREKTYSATVNAVVIDTDGAEGRLMIDPDSEHDLSLQTLCRGSTNRACFGAGMAWRRAVFSQFGRLRPGPRQVDQMIIFRSTLLGGASLIREPLMRYRLHDANLNITRMAQLASDADRRLIEERRRNNAVATVVAQRETLEIARAKNIGAWNYEELDRIVMESLFAKARAWSLFRSRMADDGIGIY